MVNPPSAMNALVRTSSRKMIQMPVAALGARGHCQVPCGIFDDPARVAGLKEDAATIRKAMVQIEELQGNGDALSFNQATRWVMTKEDHASAIIDKVGNYMLAQRVKSELFDSTSDYYEAL